MGTILASLMYVGDALLEMKMPEPTVCFSMYISAQSPQGAMSAVYTGNGSSDFLKSSEVITTLWPSFRPGHGSHNCQSILSSCSYTVTGLMTFKG